ncbi:MAG: hypothetical protein V1728_00975 [Candidatus Micrarchaeota archaeon]
MAEIKRTKVVDNWKLKSWYTVFAPGTFESKPIGQIVALEEENLANRIVKTGLGELTGSFSQGAAFTSIFFRVDKVSGKSVSTKFIGHELAPSYIKTLLRRRRSILYLVDDVVAKDGKAMRIKSVAVTAFRESENVRHDLRMAVSREIKAVAAESDLDTLVQEIVFGKFSAKVFGRVKAITPLRRLEIRKSEVVEKFDSK